MESNDKHPNEPHKSDMSVVRQQSTVIKVTPYPTSHTSPHTAPSCFDGGKRKWLLVMTGSALVVMATSVVVCVLMVTGVSDSTGEWRVMFIQYVSECLD